MHMRFPGRAFAWYCHLSWVPGFQFSFLSYCTDQNIILLAHKVAVLPKLESFAKANVLSIDALCIEGLVSKKNRP